MSPAQLRTEWMRVYKATPPAMTADLLRRGIAHRLQERAHGGLPPSTVREIDRLGRQFAKTGAVVAAPITTIKPGTRLVRDWGGKSHHVLVLDDGFLYSDRRYRSLSQIATHITGARWSGPRFFGLAQRSNAEPADA
jgi:hypothetical protein